MTDFESRMLDRKEILGHLWRWSKGITDWLKYTNYIQRLNIDELRKEVMWVVNVGRSIYTGLDESAEKAKAASKRIDWKRGF